MKIRSYDAFIYQQKHMKFIYVVAALAFVCYPLGTYLYIKLHLQAYKFIFTFAIVLFAVILVIFLRLIKGRVTIDEQTLTYERISFHLPRFKTINDHLQNDHIMKIDLNNGKYGYHAATISLLNDWHIYFALGSKDTADIVNWLKVMPDNKIIKKDVSESGSIKIVLSVLGLIILDIILIFAAIYYAT